MSFIRILLFLIILAPYQTCFSMNNNSWLVPIPSTTNQPSGLSLEDDFSKCFNLIDNLPEPENATLEDLKNINQHLNDVIVAFSQFRNNPNLKTSSDKPKHYKYINQGLALVTTLKIQVELLIRQSTH